jgi:RNA polymerase sigma factor (sigma-70 family)
MIRVVVVDDQELVREGFTAILGTQPDIEVVASAADGAAAIRLVDEQRPDVVLMDISMPGVDGVEATRVICGKHPNVRVLILTTFDHDDYVVGALAGGASGFLLKHSPRASLLAAVRAVASGDVTLERTVMERLIRDRVASSSSVDEDLTDRIDSLTPRERQVLELVAGGSTNTEVAQRLFISEATVKTHVTRLLAKLQARDRVQLVVLGHAAGIVGRSAGIADDGS